MNGFEIINNTTEEIKEIEKVKDLVEFALKYQQKRV